MEPIEIDRLLPMPIDGIEAAAGIDLAMQPVEQSGIDSYGHHGTGRHVFICNTPVHATASAKYHPATGRAPLLAAVS